MGSLLALPYWRRFALYLPSAAEKLIRLDAIRPWFVYGATLSPWTATLARAVTGVPQDEKE